MKRNIDRIPTLADFEIPTNNSLEKVVLAELINNPDQIIDNLHCLTEELFFKEENKQIYKVIMNMYNNAENIDLMSVCAKCEKEYFMSEILSQSAGLGLALKMHLQELQLVMQKRKLYFASIKNIQNACSTGVTLSQVMDAPKDLEKSLESGINTDTTEDITDVFTRVADDIEKGRKKKIPTGFRNLNWFLYGGFAQGSLNILAARPSVGKTALMLQMAIDGAVNNDFKALILSIEMPNVELGQRLLTRTEVITPQEINASKENFKWDKFERAIGEYKKGMLYLDEKPNTIEEVCSNITLNHHRGKCDIVFIDYLQLMSSTEKRDSLYVQVTEMTKKLKQLAKRLSIPIVLLCQLNRNAADRAPQLQDLRDSGSIEQDADVVLMLERLKNEQGENTNKVNMYLQKNRAGAGGGIKIELESNESYTKFYEI